MAGDICSVSSIYSYPFLHRYYRRDKDGIRWQYDLHLYDGRVFHADLSKHVRGKCPRGRWRWGRFIRRWRRGRFLRDRREPDLQSRRDVLGGLLGWLHRDRRRWRGRRQQQFLNGWGERKQFRVFLDNRNGRWR